MHSLSASIQIRIEILAALGGRIEHARETLAEIVETTWGVTLLETDGERFVVLPDGTLDHRPWTVRAAFFEAVERVRGLYDQVGGTVGGSLAEVVRAVRDGSAEHSDEQQWNSEQAEALQRCLERLSVEDESLLATVRATRRLNEMHGPGLHDVRREVARALEVMCGRGRERDQEPSG